MKNTPPPTPPPIPRARLAPSWPELGYKWAGKVHSGKLSGLQNFAAGPHSFFAILFPLSSDSVSFTPSGNDPMQVMYAH